VVSARSGLTSSQKKTPTGSTAIRLARRLRPWCDSSDDRIHTRVLGFHEGPKKFWLLPLMTVMIILGILIVLTEGSAVAPFIYAIF